MDKYYLQRPDGSYSDVGFYAEKPTARPDGIWVQGEPDGERYRAKSPIEVINNQFNTLNQGSRRKLRSALSEGFIALQVGNMQSVADIIADLETGNPNPSETEFINFVKTTLGVE